MVDMVAKAVPDIAICAVAWEASWPLKLIAAVNLLEGVLSSDSLSDKARKACLGELSKVFWKAAVRRFTLLNRKWIVELLSGKTGDWLLRLSRRDKTVQ